jgi:transposase
MKKSDVTCPECSAGYRSDRANLKPGAEPANLDVHIIMVNYATHKTKSIRNWFAKRPRWNVHFTPTSASWINQVERFFALLTERALKRGVFRSVAELEKAIKAYIEATNADPKPFRWTKTADDILASIQRFCLRTLAANV